MTLAQIAATRLHNQQVAGTQLTKPAELVRWMGAMQAQDPLMVKWAVGLRLKNTTEAKVIAAMDKGEILRTHVLRPTWHLVAAEDIHWMLELSAANIRRAMGSNNKAIGLTEAIFKKSSRIIEKALSAGEHLTREELAPLFEKAKIDLSANRFSHILFWAELQGLVCSGALKQGKHSYALLDERAPHKQKLNKEEMLGKLAATYFTSHGPATLKDFTWWSGLSITEARLALELVKTTLESAAVGEETFWFSGSLHKPGAKTNDAYLLASFDELLISYKDRSATLDNGHQRHAMTNNGIFWPVVVVGGRVCGVWKRSLGKKEVTIETSLLPGQPTAVLKKIAKRAGELGRFLNKPVKVIHGRL